MIFISLKIYRANCNLGGDCIGRPGDSDDVDLMNHKLHTDADGILNSYLDQNGHGKDAVQF